MLAYWDRCRNLTLQSRVSGIGGGVRVAFMNEYPSRPFINYNPSLQKACSALQGRCLCRGNVRGALDLLWFSRLTLTGY